MPAVKIKPKRSSSSSSSSSSTQSRMVFAEDEVVNPSPVLIIVDGEDIEVYTGKEAEDKLAE
jgi:hypothetical protein